MTKPTAIDKALNAVFDLFKSKQDKKSIIKTYIDDGGSSLENLAEALVRSDNKSKMIPVLIGMESKNAKNLRPYSDLLGQLLKRERNPLGVNESIHSIVPALLKYLQDNEDPRKREHTVLVKPQSVKFQARIPEIQESEHLKTAVTSLLDWAKLESNLPAPTTPFCRLAGGVKPIVYVFDDYINFIDHEPDDSKTDSPAVYRLPKEQGENASPDSKGSYYGEFPKKENPNETEITLLPKITKFYSDTSSSQAENLILPLKGFAGCLNNLSVAFDVQTPLMNFEPLATGEINYFQQVTKLLNFSELDENRNQIAAFIIDLEWLPSPKWIRDTPDARQKWKNPPGNDQMGYYAVRLLTQRYPEIPCFIYTGMWSIETLQESLANGAAWCFQKSVSHHFGSSKKPEEELNYLILEKHLTEFAKRTYGAYQEIPNPQQFKSCLNPEDNQAFEQKIPIDDKFKRLIAHMFTTDRVEVIKILSGGKSGAKTFFVRPTSNNFTEATRFVKVDSWSKIQQEYASYQQIIRPKLNNHIARIIQKPSVIIPASGSSDTSPPLAGIVSSLAGFPENYDRLNSLAQLIEKHINDPDGSVKISKIINSTLEFILLPLHKPLVENKYNLSTGFPCIATGKLLDIHNPFTDNNSSEEIMTPLRNWEFNGATAKKIASLDPKTQKTVIRDYASIVLFNPETQAKVELDCTSTENLMRRFGSLWLKSGMKVSVNVKMDINSNYIQQKFYNYQEWQICKDSDEFPSKIEELIEFWNRVTNQPLPEKENPFDYFESSKLKTGNIPEQKGTFGAIHGDLNLSNILYPGDEETGFLIDFTYAKAEGLVVLDIAWIEAQIWNYYLFPNIVELARYFPSSVPNENPEKICYLLSIAIEAANHSKDPDILFADQIDSIKKDNPVLIRILNILRSTHSARQLMTQNLGVNFNRGEINYALAVSFLQHTRFNASKETAQSSAWVGTQSFLCASYYLDRYITEIGGQNN
jgi:Ternary complex associated domain 9